MGSEWQEYRLGDVAEWFSGGTPSKSNEEFWNGDIPWISASSMDGNRYGDSKHRVTETGLQSGGKLALAGSILLLVRGSILHQKIQVGIAERDLAFNQDVKALSVKDNILEPWYLLFWFMSQRQKLLGLVENTGIGAGKLDTKVLQDLVIRVPPKEERQRILSFGKSLDDKIELNLQMNTTLEALAQALFKSWFVDFDPVIDNALAAGHPIPDELAERAELRKRLQDRPAASTSAALTPRQPLPAAIQQQFPDRFVFTEEMGWVPEGWKFRPIAEFGSVVCGKTPSKVHPEYFGGVVPFIKIPDMHNSIFIVGPGETLTKLGANSQIKKMIPRGSVCVSCIATVGKVSITTVDSQTNQQINSIVPREENFTPYIYFYMLTLEKHFHDLASGGSATLNMNTSTFSKVKIIDPDDKLIHLFGETVRPHFAKIERNQVEGLVLTQLRDTLLPKLLSGQLRIPVAEQMLAEAL